MNTNEITVTMNTKELRKIASEIGYGATMGVCRALFVTYICIGAVKAIKDYSEKRIERKNKESKEAEKETVEE